MSGSANIESSSASKERSRVDVDEAIDDTLNTESVMKDVEGLWPCEDMRSSSVVSAPTAAVSDGAGFTPVTFAGAGFASTNCGSCESV